MSASPGKYTKVAIGLHWLIAAIMLFLLVFGEDLIRRREGVAIPIEDYGPTTHASWGMLLLLLSVLRLVWRLMNPPPPLPVTMKPWEKTLSHITHVVFYVLMIGVPLLGLFAFASYAPARPGAETASFFNLFSVAFMPDLGSWTMDLHAISTKLAWALIALHVLAALKHQFIDKDGLMRRMMFR